MSRRSVNAITPRHSVRTGAMLAAIALACLGEPARAQAPAPAEPVVQARPDTPIARNAATMAPGSWRPLATRNKLVDVFPKREGHPAWGVVGPVSVVRTWNGGAVGDGKLYVWGGGHLDYGGNEIYALDLVTLTWSRLTEPSAYEPGCQDNQICRTVDGTPVSVHSYDGMEWLPQLGKLWVGGGSSWKSGAGHPQAFLFDPRTRKWERAPDIFGDWLQSDYDPVTNALFVTGSQTGAIRMLDGRTLKTIGQSGRSWTYDDVSGAFDFHRRLFVVLGTRQMVVWALPKGPPPPNGFLPGGDLRKTARIEDGKRVDFHPPLAHRAALAYHPPSRRFAMWNGDPSIYVLDPETWVWSEIKPRGNEAPSTWRDAERKQLKSAGIYGRWRWLPEYGVFLGYNDESGVPWLFKMP